MRGIFFFSFPLSEPEHAKSSTDGMPGFPGVSPGNFKVSVWSCPLQEVRGKHTNTFVLVVDDLLLVQHLQKAAGIFSS